MSERELGVLEIDLGLYLVALGTHLLFLELEQVVRGRQADAESYLLIVERLASVVGRGRSRGRALIVGIQIGERALHIDDRLRQRRSIQHALLFV